MSVMPSAWAETPGEARFFADCPARRYVQLHNERNPWDLHALLYSGLGVSELEILRTADWLVDLPLPGARLHPFQRLRQAIRSGYNRVHRRWRSILHVGEFVDALQLAELSFGDATATYSVATGSATGPGSGMVVRVHRLIDWSQHVVGDVNRVCGRPFGFRQGLVPWALPGRAVDGMQWALVKTFNAVSVAAARALDQTLTVSEMAAEGVVNAGYHRPHQEETVFFRVPMDAYRAHELWILERRQTLVIATVEELRASTHARLAHRRRRVRPSEWSPVDQWPAREDVVLMTTLRVAARAPASLKAYVVPAEWVLEDAGNGSI
ncbi:MAG: hypothetical protein A3B78_02490 [Omnitrophica WOR_2 bacterium RIFCSPHIGHO2_02_FULL_67_20]|nr:MAG: hypothetical protein A3B78_02490 [Omnitrophica WOR_2 bacterium RIFCSPHIGHO2_02_FULL_67_20]